MAEPSILYEDESVLVLNKPAGLVVHADGKTEERTLVDWVLSRYPDLKGVGEPLALEDGQTIDRSGIVHRLDRETSGAIVIAKTSESHAFLKRQFKEREVRKVYRLFVWDEMKRERGIINRPIGKSPVDFRQWSSGRGARGELREAITWFRVLARKNGFSYVEAQPRTGRTHQIRVHFKAINHPVVSDMLYSPKRGRGLGFERTALHARAVTFKLKGGKEITVNAPYPEDFVRALQELGLPLIA